MQIAKITNRKKAFWHASVIFNWQQVAGSPLLNFFLKYFFLVPGHDVIGLQLEQQFSIFAIFFLPLLVSFSHSADTLHISLENWSSTPSSRLGFCSAFVSSQQSFV